MFEVILWIFAIIGMLTVAAVITALMIVLFSKPKDKPYQEEYDKMTKNQHHVKRR